MLLLIYNITEKNAQIAAFIWVTIISTALLLEMLSPLFSKKVLEKSDYYSEYIFDSDYFFGKQRDWQYNNFKFEIKK